MAQCGEEMSRRDCMRNVMAQLARLPQRAVRATRVVDTSTPATCCPAGIRHLGKLRLGLALLCPVLLSASGLAKDWPQWCGTDAKNMVSEEKGLPDLFVPGERDFSASATIKMDTTRNVKWARKVCQAVYATPVIAGGKIFVGGRRPKQGLMTCLDERTGKPLWQWQGPARNVPDYIDGWLIGIRTHPEELGVCSSPAVEGDRLYFVTHSFKVLCLDVNGEPPSGTEPGNARVIWEYDMWDKLGVFPCDAANSSPVIDGELVYVMTSNGIDHNMDARKEKNRKMPAPNAPNVIALEKRTGRLVATDDTPTASRMLHGQWSSLSLGTVAGRKLLFFGAGDGFCYALEPLSAVPEKPVKLKTIWSFDCNPPEYKACGELDWVTHYCMGDRRWGNNSSDGTFVGTSEIIGTPVFLNNRIYVALGRDPEHGRGRGAMHCIDATKTGDITTTGKIWTYQGLDRTLCTASVADGLVYIGDVAGRLHCLDAETGQCYWVHETNSQVWGSTLVADGKVYYPTTKSLVVLAAGKKKNVLGQVNVGAPVYASPVVANGVLYVASKTGWLWAVCQGTPKPVSSAN
jgi:outer membrane protein assembly factor BamB